GLITMMALPWRAPPTASIAPAVVRVNSSILRRVPGPTERDDTVATISPYATGCTRDTAYTIGMVACPPHVTMLTFISLLPIWVSRLTGGTQNGPIAAGVRSITRTPRAV